MSKLNEIADRAAGVTPPSLAGAVRGLSDKSIAWIFIAPTIILLLAINIFPLIRARHPLMTAVLLPQHDQQFH